VFGSDPREGADPYESVHRNKEGLLMQDEWEAVLNLYRELGLQRSEECTRARITWRWSWSALRGCANARRRRWRPASCRSGLVLDRQA